MRNLILLLIAFLPFSYLKAYPGNLTDPVSEKSIFDLIHYQDILEIDIELNLNNLLSDRRSEDSFDATFSFYDLKGEKQFWNTKVEIRGKFRRIMCEEMPPLRLNFKKGDLKEAGLAKFDDLKMVTQCVDDPNEAKQLLLKEFLAYKIYNKITDVSFRVQLVKINFTDTETKESRLQYGFLIEDTAQLRNRLNADKHENIFGVTSDQLEASSYANMVLFQHMIGNADWSVIDISRNVKVVRKGDKLIPVPYDFDFSELVGAEYANTNLNNRMRLENVQALTEMASNMNVFEESIAVFNRQKREIIQLIKNNKLIKKADRKRIIELINLFYQDINMDS